MDVVFVIKALFAIYTFATLSFFQPLNLISGEVAKGVSYIAMVAIFILAAMCDNNDGIRHRRQFARPMRWLMLFIGVSILMPTISYFEQSIAESFICTLPFFSYGLYFALRKFDIEIEYYIRLTISIIILAIVTHVTNLYTFPEITFGTPLNEYDFERGGLRLIIQGFNFVVLGLFIALSQIKADGGKRWWLLLVVCYGTIIASYTRQHIIVCALLIAFALLSKAKGFISRSLIALMLIAVSFVALPRIQLFKNLTDITIEQYDDHNNSIKNENVRISAIKYYGWEAFENTSNRLFGNGVPSYHSKWGAKVKNYADHEHTYMADVGWFGFNWYFGIFAVVAMLAVCISAISKRNRVSDLGRYYFIWFTVTSLINGALLYQYEIVVTIIALSIIDHQNEHYIEEDEVSYH